jgi:hypothetical protein
MAGYGARLVRSAGMEGYTGNTFNYPIDPANSNPIFWGDFVRLNASGYLEEASGGADNNDFDIMGTSVGCSYTDGEGSVKFRQFWGGEAGASGIVGKVAMPGHSRLYIKGAAGATYTRANTIGRRFGVTYEVGSPQYGDSRIALGATSATTGPLLVVGLAELPGNSWDSEEPIFEVVIARPQAGSA